MTPQEAILRIKNYIEVHSRKEKHFAIKITEALKMAIEALEKQIPKKPKKDEYGYYLCPSCMTDDYALMHDSNFENRYNYCHNCGQALDWSDQNER